MNLKRSVLLIGIGLGLGTGGWAYLHRTPPPVASDSGARCEACHGEQVSGWRQGGHKTLDCDVCHGSPGGHVMETVAPRPRLVIEGPEHCLGCHQRRKGESEEPPRIDGLAEHLTAVEKKHVTSIDRDRVGEACSFCHEPHSLE